MFSSRPIRCYYDNCVSLFVPVSVYPLSILYLCVWDAVLPKYLEVHSVLCHVKATFWSSVVPSAVQQCVFCWHDTFIVCYSDDLCEILNKISKCLIWLNFINTVAGGLLCNYFVRSNIHLIVLLYQKCFKRMDSSFNDQMLSR